MRVHVTIPRTLPGRLIAGLLAVAGVILALFFFTAILIVVAVVAAVFLVRSALAGKKKRDESGAKEISAHYEVLKEEERPRE